MAPRRSWAKANSPYWSSHVTSWYSSRQDEEEYCRRRNLSIKTFEMWVRHLVSDEDLHQRTEKLRKQRGKKGLRQVEMAPPNGRTGPHHLRYGARSGDGPIALRAFWSMHVEAMNWSGMGLAEYAAALGLSPYALRKWRDRLEDSGDEMDWRSLLHPSARAQLSSAANSVLRKYRLTPDAVDGRSNPRRRLSDEQKRAIVQETEEPGVSVSQVCRRHGIATSMLFRWRVQFGLAAKKKAPQLATVALAEGATSELPALAALRALMHPPDSLSAVESDDGRRVLVPAGGSLSAKKKQPARRKKAT